MTLIPRGWNMTAQDFLNEALADDTEFIKNEVLNGVSILWECVGCGWLVTRQEGQELVFVAGAGINAKAVIQLFINNSKKLNIKTYRIHSTRAGMGRYLKALGFVESERVYRKI